MLFAFIYTAGYSGNLRAFLMNPEVERPIDSVAAVVESGMGKYKVVMGSGLKIMHHNVWCNVLG